MEHWEMDIKKINEFNFLNVEFTRRWSQNYVTVRSSALVTWSKKLLNIVYEACILLSFSFEHGVLLYG